MTNTNTPDVKKIVFACCYSAVQVLVKYLMAVYEEQNAIWSKRGFCSIAAKCYTEY